MVSTFALDFLQAVPGSIPIALGGRGADVRILHGTCGATPEAQNSQGQGVGGVRPASSH